MRILPPIPSFDHSNSGIVAAPDLQRLRVGPQRTGEDLPPAARALFRVSRGNPDRGCPPMPQYDGDTSPARLHSPTPAPATRKRKNPNPLGVRETTSKHLCWNRLPGPYPLSSRSLFHSDLDSAQ